MSRDHDHSQKNSSVFQRLEARRGRPRRAARRSRGQDVDGLQAHRRVVARTYNASVRTAAAFLLSSGRWRSGRAAAAAPGRRRRPRHRDPRRQRALRLAGDQGGGEAGAPLVILRIDTPGGRLDSTRVITQAILGSPVPVVGWVAPPGSQAASAGFIVLMSCDVAAMAPGTNAGAASPVGGGGEDLPKTIAKKVGEDVSALLRSVTEPRGRPVDDAVKAVTDAASYSETEAEKREADRGRRARPSGPPRAPRRPDREARREARRDPEDGRPHDRASRR